MNRTRRESYSQSGKINRWADLPILAGLCIGQHVLCYEGDDGSWGRVGVCWELLLFDRRATGNRCFFEIFRQRRLIWSHLVSIILIASRKLIIEAKMRTIRWFKSEMEKLAKKNKRNEITAIEIVRIQKDCYVSSSRISKSIPEWSNNLLGMSACKGRAPHSLWSGKWVAGLSQKLCFLRKRVAKAWKLREKVIAIRNSPCQYLFYLLIIEETGQNLR